MIKRPFSLLINSDILQREGAELKFIFNVLKSNYLKTCRWFFILQWWYNKKFESCFIPEKWKDLDWIFHHVCMDWNPDHGCLKIKQIKGTVSVISSGPPWMPNLQRYPLKLVWSIMNEIFMILFFNCLFLYKSDLRISCLQ